MTRKLSDRRKEQAAKAGEGILRDIDEAKRLKAQGRTESEIAKVLKRPECVVRVFLSGD